MAKNDVYSQWLGIGAKSGGQLLFGGYESTTAKLWCLGDGESFDLEICAGRYGFGLGGSGGLVAVIGYGFTVPEELHREAADDWGVSVALTEKLISRSIVSSFELAIRFLKIAKSTGMTKLTPSLVENLRNLGHTLFQAVAVAQKRGVIVIDIPGAGMGVELSAYVTRGRMYVSNSTDWIEPQSR